MQVCALMLVMWYSRAGAGKVLSRDAKVQDCLGIDCRYLAKCSL